MTLNDPRGGMDARDRVNPGRRRVVDERPGWVTPAIIGALLLAGILAFAASNRDRTARTPAPETTSRSERAVPPAAPLPANPNATTPQAAPEAPRPQ